MKKVLTFVAMLLCMTICSCTNDDEQDYAGKSESEITEKFKEYFYDSNDNVRLSQLDGFSSQEWACVSLNGMRPVEVFADITGYDVAMPDGKYEYRFVSADGRCKISIDGNTTADEDAVYAVMQVEIPDCQEVKTIIVGSLDYAKGTNDGTGAIDVTI